MRSQKAPDIWVPHVMLGEALQERGSREEAVAEYRLAISLRPSEPVPLHAAGAVPGRDGPAGRGARGVPERCVTLEPGVGGRAGTAWAPWRCCKAKYDEARQHYRSALEAHPERRRGAAVAGDDCRDGVAESGRGAAAVRRGRAAWRQGHQGIDDCIEPQPGPVAESRPSPLTTAAVGLTTIARLGGRRDRRSGLDAGPHGLQGALSRHRRAASSGRC